MINDKVALVKDLVTVLQGKGRDFRGCISSLLAFYLEQATEPL